MGWQGNVKLPFVDENCCVDVKLPFMDEMYCSWTNQNSALHGWKLLPLWMPNCPLQMKATAWM
jgi:hypothetical protein